jgi:hypothetical protein
MSSGEWKMTRNLEGRKILGPIAAILSLSALIACGQNAHVTRPDPAIGPHGSQISQIDDEPTGGGSQIPDGGTISTPTNPGTYTPTPTCYETITQHYPIRGVSYAERKNLELPYIRQVSRIQSYGYPEVPAQVSSHCMGCGATSLSQSIFAVDLNRLPNRNHVGQVKRVALELRLVRPTVGLAGNELFCLLNERLCSGTRGNYLNEAFWRGVSENEKSYMSRYYVDRLLNDEGWLPRKAENGVGTLHARFVLDLGEMAEGSRYDLEAILYSGGNESGKTLYMAIADNLATCMGQLVVELEVNHCPNGERK